MCRLNKPHHYLHIFLLEAQEALHSAAVTEHMLIFCLLSDLMERSLGVNTFQLAKKLVDKVISVRYCIYTSQHIHTSQLHLKALI